MCRRGTLNWATDVVFTFVYLWSSAIHSYVQTIIYGRNSRPDNWLITHSVSHKYSTVRTYVRTYVFMYVYVCVCVRACGYERSHIKDSDRHWTQWGSSILLLSLATCLRAVQHQYILSGVSLFQVHTYQVCPQEFCTYSLRPPSCNTCPVWRRHPHFAVVTALLCPCISGSLWSCNTLSVTQGYLTPLLGPHLCTEHQTKCEPP